MYLINLSCALCHFVHSCRPQHFPGPGMVARQGQCGRRHQNSKRHLQCTFGEHLNGSEWSPEWSSEWSLECPECPEWSKYVNVLARPFFFPLHVIPSHEPRQPRYLSEGGADLEKYHSERRTQQSDCKSRGAFGRSFLHKYA